MATILRELPITSMSDSLFANKHERKLCPSPTDPATKQFPMSVNFLCITFKRLFSKAIMLDAHLYPENRYIKLSNIS